MADAEGERSGAPNATFSAVAALVWGKHANLCAIAAKSPLKTSCWT